ncbi:MAG: imidazole glycerol phosphate synthase subunit HisH [Candidatus Micrarchaeota archaeon]
MIAVVDYGMGNLRSVSKALDLLGFKNTIVSEPEALENAERIILPGVGAFGDAMDNLRERGWIPKLENEVLVKRKPVLGVCLGMQLLAENSSENGEHNGLGWIKASVRRFEIDEKKFKVPHVGWNNVTSSENSRLFKGIENGKSFYFVHSYHAVCKEPEVISATCEYGEVFAAAIEKGNVYGTQFHPEKSQKWGLAVLKNFVTNV